MSSIKLINQYNRLSFRSRVKKGYMSVIIPVYKDVLGLRDTLDSLRKQTIDKGRYEIIVANDGSDAEISKLCKSYDVYEVKINTNKGSYNARNRVLEVSRGEYLAFTDADVVVPGNWLEQGLELLERYDYVGGAVKFPDPLPRKLPHRYESLYAFKVADYFTSGKFCVTANLFTSRRVMESVGGFDRRLRSGGDVEFGNRVNINGHHSQGYSGELYVVHPFRDTIGILRKKRRVIQGMGDLLVYFPDRFREYKPALFDSLLWVTIPPVKFIVDPMLFGYIWYMKMVDFIYRVKYIRPMSLFLSNCRIYRLRRWLRLFLVPGQR